MHQPRIASQTPSQTPSRVMMMMILHRHQQQPNLQPPQQINVRHNLASETEMLTLIVVPNIRSSASEIANSSLGTRP